jgi:hypothetical protein
MNLHIADGYNIAAALDIYLIIISGAASDGIKSLGELKLGHKYQERVTLNRIRSGVSVLACSYMKDGTETEFDIRRRTLRTDYSFF